MKNQLMVEGAMRRNFQTKLLSAVVATVMTNALPLDRAALEAERPKLAKYCNRAMEALHADTMLERAIKRNAGDNQKMRLLRNLNEEIGTIASEAAKRCAEDACAVDTPGTPVKDLVDKTAFTAGEMKRFEQSGDKIGVEELSNIVNKKVVTALKSERESFEKDEELTQKLQEAASEATRLGENVTMESLLGISIPANLPLHHVSFLSKLQDSAMEMLLFSNYTPDGKSEIPYDVLMKTTLESTLDVFDLSFATTDDMLDSLSICSESYMDGNADRVPTMVPTSMILSVIIYTFFETLKTMNLFSPDQKTVRAFVERPVSIKRVIANGDDSPVKDRLLALVQNIRKDAVASNDVNDLQASYDSLQGLREKITGLPVDYKAIQESLMASIEDTDQFIKGKIEGIAGSSHHQAMESVFVSRKLNQNVASLNRIANSYGKHPEIGEIRIVLESATSSDNLMEVEIRQINGTCVSKTAFDLERDDAFGDAQSTVKLALEQSNLVHSPKKVSLYLQDRCQVIPINY